MGRFWAQWGACLDPLGAFQPSALPAQPGLPALPGWAG
jgi:hypothetical protein